MEKTAYKLMRKLSDGNIYPLFINKKCPTKFGKWLKAECYPTKGFAVRKGWHCCFSPVAPHLKEKLSSGEQRVWVKVKVKNYTTYNRPESQGGKWILADEMFVVKELSKREVDKIIAKGA